MTLLTTNHVLLQLGRLLPRVHVIRVAVEEGELMVTLSGVLNRLCLLQPCENPIMLSELNVYITAGRRKVARVVPENSGTKAKIRLMAKWLSI